MKPEAFSVDALLRMRRTRKLLDGPRLSAQATGTAARLAFDASLRAAISSAGWAPFHYACDPELPEPWRFTVLDRDALDTMMVRFPQCLPGKLPSIVAGAGAMVQVSFCAEQDLALTARNEDHHSATAAAAMALLLACEERGLGSYWCTAHVLNAPELRAWCGMDPQERWLGAIFVGLPLSPEREAAEGFSGKLRGRRTSAGAGWMRWVGGDGGATLKATE